jgi:hypothetical protein
MKLLDEDVACREFPIRFDQLCSDANRIWGVVYGLMPNGSVVAPEVEPRLRWALAGIHTKQVRLTRSIFLLLEHGLDHEAKLQLRTMFELFLHLSYIHKSTDKYLTARYFVLWNQVNAAKVAEILSQKKLHSDGWKQLRDKLRPIIEQYKKEIENIALPGFIRGLLRYKLFRRVFEVIGLERFVKASRQWKAYVQYGPPMKYIETLSREFKLDIDYDHVYRDCSAVVHSYDALFYVQPGEKTFSVQMASTIDDVYLIGMTSLHFLVKSTLLIDKALSLGKENEIKELEKLKVFQPPIAS